jgi:hypothetical protein
MAPIATPLRSNGSARFDFQPMFRITWSNSGSASILRMWTSRRSSIARQVIEARVGTRGWAARYAATADGSHLPQSALR